MNWAILGTGKIARRFAYALNNIPDKAQLLAVGSRTQATADAFADEFHIERRYAGYENAVADPDIDIVYVGTPGILHHRDAALCLEAGKHVLCEKVMCINAKETRDLVGLARRKDLFLMEAMWTRFFPVHVRLRELVAEGAIGPINGMVMLFAAQTPFDLKNRFFDVALGAGVLIDIGSYGVALTYNLLGKPDKVMGTAYFGESGADYQGTYILQYDAGPISTIVCSQTSYDVKEAFIYGPKGKIVIHDPWYKPTALTLHVEGKEPELCEYPLNGWNGYEYEAMHVMERIQAGHTESDVIPLDESIAIVGTLDELRAQWGYKYPTE
jgi:predicted dehydrogenase